MEHRIVRLEETIVLQDRVIEQLSDALAVQQAEIDELKRQIKLLGERVRSAAQGAEGDSGEEPPPPHYL